VPALPARPGVTTIRSGGPLTPIFFIHDGLGETLLYRGLALRLDPERSIYGVEPLRTSAGTFAHTRIDEMAEEYVARIRTVQPHGPYLLAGLCAGGVIAFEMARQLQDAGETVAFVGILDAADVAAAKRPFYITRTRLARVGKLLNSGSSAALVPALTGRAARAVAWEVHSRVRRARDRQAVRRLQSANAAGSIPAAVPETGGLPFLKLYEVAHRAHRPQGLFAGGDVVLFKASEGSGAIEDVPYQAIYSDYALGWGRRTSEDVAVVAVPGGHGSLLQEPHVGTLARHFQAAIDSAIWGLEPGERQPGPVSSRAVAAVAAE